MEVVQHYLNRYHKAMEKLNVLPPSIEPHASGHIIEQIEYIKEILKADMPMKAKAPCISTFQNITATTITANFQAATLTNCWPPRAHSTANRKSVTLPISPYGKRPHPNI